MLKNGNDLATNAPNMADNASERLCDPAHTFAELIIAFPPNEKKGDRVAGLPIHSVEDFLDDSGNVTSVNEAPMKTPAISDADRDAEIPNQESRGSSTEDQRGSTVASDS